MKRFFFLCTIILMFFACKQTADTPNANEKPDVSFSSSPPGTLYWIANAGWEAKGVFDKWKFTNFEIPDNDLSKINAEVAVKISSVNHEDKSLESHLRKNDYLDAKQFPVATIKINGAKYNNDADNYTTNAIVNLKGKTQEIPLVFSVKENTINGSGTLFRKNHNVGDDSGVQNEVGINFEFDIPE